MNLVDKLPDFPVNKYGKFYCHYNMRDKEFVLYNYSSASFNVKTDSYNQNCLRILSGYNAYKIVGNQWVSYDTNRLINLDSSIFRTVYSSDNIYVNNQLHTFKNYSEINGSILHDSFTSSYFMNTLKPSVHVLPIVVPAVVVFLGLRKVWVLIRSSVKGA